MSHGSVFDYVRSWYFSGKEIPEAIPNSASVAVIDQ
jgi:hypothetical protein